MEMWKEVRLECAADAATDGWGRNDPLQAEWRLLSAASKQWAEVSYCGGMLNCVHTTVIIIIIMTELVLHRCSVSALSFLSVTIRM